MQLDEVLNLPHGVTAVVGGGGKTTLLWRLANEASQNGTALITTTTHIWPPACRTLLSPTRTEIEAAFGQTNLLAAGEMNTEGKLGPVGMLRGTYDGLADYVLVEADGAKSLPIKAPDEHEPALPQNAALTIAVAGMTCVGKRVRDAAHRPLRYAELSGLGPDDVVTPEAVARVIEHPQGQRKGVNGRFVVVLNQTDTDERLEFARETAKLLSAETLIVALKTRPNWLEHWQNGIKLR